MISVVIPYYEVDEGKREVLKKCTNSLKGHDETIIVWNDKMGYAPAINRGVENTRGDFVVVMNDDVYLKEGDLTMLCKKGYVTSPSYNGKTYKYLWGSCFCMPMDIWKLVGGMDERYTISYFDDDHLIMALKSHGIPFKAVPEVVFGHDNPGRTLEQMPERNEFFESNKLKFIEKWGKLLE